MNRYERNKQMISEKDQQVLKRASVCIVGCGGLGGYVLEMLTRIGIGHITIVDGDVFDPSNLNRQLMSSEPVLGQPKVDVAKTRMHEVNSEVVITAKQVFIDEGNALSVLEGHDVIVDALDSIDARMVVMYASELLKLPFVHGAIAGWYGQVTTIFPTDRTLEKIYKEGVVKGIEKQLGNPSFTPGLVASIQVSEVVKVLLGKGDLLRGKVFLIDLKENEFNQVILQSDDN